jgi:hypothetical protein
MCLAGIRGAARFLARFAGSRAMRRGGARTMGLREPAGVE